MVIPKVSILMPVYNGARFLDTTLRCLQNQTFGDFEIVVIDDASTDDSYRKLQVWRDKEPRIRLFHHDSNRGVFETQAELASLAKADLLAQQDQDDYSAPNRLEIQVATLRDHPDAVGTVSNVWLVDENGHPIGTTRIPTTPGQLREAMKRSNVCWHSSLMMRKSAFDQAGGYDRDADHVADYDLMLRLLERGDLIPNSEPLATYGLSPGTVTYRDRATQEALAQAIRHKYFDAPAPARIHFQPLDAKAARMLYHKEVGRMCMVKGDSARARDNYARLHELQPTLKNRLRLLSCGVVAAIVKYGRRARGKPNDTAGYFLRGGE